MKETQDFQDITDENFNDILVNMQKASIVNVCSQVFNDSSYIDRNLIYTKALNKTDVETLPDGFYGYRIRVENEKDIAFKITRVLLDFDGTGDFELLLFNTAKKEPIQTKTISITTDHQVVKLDWVCDNSDDTYKGDYYIGYISTGLTIKPFKRNYLDSIVMSLITHLEITKVFVAGQSDNNLFNLNTVQFPYATSGLNFDITVYDDFTDLIIQNQSLFARCIYLDMVISFLHTYSTTLRSNRSERISEEIVNRALMEIEGFNNSSGLNIKGLKPQLSKEIGQLRNEIDKLKRGYFGNEIMVITQE